jgi:hypothetical protein
MREVHRDEPSDPSRTQPLLKIPYYLSPGWLKIDPNFDPPCYKNAARSPPCPECRGPFTVCEFKHSECVTCHNARQENAK